LQATGDAASEQNAAGIDVRLGLFIATVLVGLGACAKEPPDVPRVLADERRIKQVLPNLLSNAVKFTQSGGSVGVRVRVTGEGIVGMDVVALRRSDAPAHRPEVPLVVATLGNDAGAVGAAALALEELG